MPAVFCAAFEWFQGEGDPDTFGRSPDFHCTSDCSQPACDSLPPMRLQGASLSTSERVHLKIWGYLPSHCALVSPPWKFYLQDGCVYLRVLRKKGSSRTVQPCLVVQEYKEPVWQLVAASWLLCWGNEHRKHKNPASVPQVEARNWIGGWLEYVGDRARSISKGNQSREGSLFFTEQHQCRLLPRWSGCVFMMEMKSGNSLLRDRPHRFRIPLLKHGQLAASSTHGMAYLGSVLSETEVRGDVEGLQSSASARLQRRPGQTCEQWQSLRSIQDLILMFLRTICPSMLALPISVWLILVIYCLNLGPRTASRVLQPSMAQGWQ